MPSADKSTRLTVNGEGEVEVEYVIEFLRDLQNAYNSILIFEIVSRRLIDWPFEPYFGPGPFLIRRGPRRRGIQVVGEWPADPESITAMVPTRERLVLDAVEIASPGFWEFLGSLNPLEVIRKYLNDRHERRKDREYREDAEKRRLDLENLKQEVGVIRDFVSLARDAGATDRDLAPIINRLIERPLRALDKHQDRGVISNAEVGPPRERLPAPEVDER